MGRLKKEVSIVKINKNMLRERGEKLPEVTDEMFEECNKDNKKLIKEFIEMHPLLSKQTKSQYWSGTKQFCWWLKTCLNDKPFYKVSKRDFNRYLSYLINRGMSSSGIKFKKSCVSTICEYAERILSEEIDEYKTFHNFTKTDIKIPKNSVYNKIAISETEYKLLIDTLMGDENYLAVAWIACAFNTGARRGGLRGFKTEIIYKTVEEGQEFVMSNTVREKGMSIDGKQVSYIVPISVLYYLKLWVEKRGYESEYLFTTNYNGISQISLSWADDLCANILSDILLRRINPHLFKASAISHYLESGMDLKFVSKNIAQHNDISTTSNFYDLRTFASEKNDMLKKIKFIETKTEEDVMAERIIEEESKVIEETEITE